MLHLLLLACTSARDDTSVAGKDSAAPAPTGDAVDDAIPLVGSPISDTIDPAGDADYWSVELEAGQTLEAQTVTVEGDPNDADFLCDGSYDTNPLDTVVLVYDPEGVEVAAADDWWAAECGRDSIAMVRADEAGTWTVAVTDWNNWEEGGVVFGNPAVGGPEYGYTLYTTVGEPEAGGGDLPDTPVAAALDDGTADAWTVDVPERAWVSFFNPTGSSAPVDELELSLSDTDGAELAWTDSDAFYGTRWGLGLTVPLEPGEYVLSVAEDGEGGGDAWYWLWTSTDAASAANPEQEPDDDAASATPVGWRDGEGEYEGEYVQAQVDGWVEAGDADVFALDVADGQYLYVSVYAGQVGSLLDAAVSVVDVDGTTVLATADAASPSISGARPSADGVVTLSFSGVDAEAEGYYLAYLELWDSRRPW